MELSEFVTTGRVEHVYRESLRHQKAGDVASRSFAERGLRAARARDSKLLLALELMEKCLDKLTEDQLGRYQRDPGTIRDMYAHTATPTELGLIRAAYKACDEGLHSDLAHYQWIYGAAAQLAFG